MRLNRYNISSLLIAFLAVGFSSCSDFLDKDPDSRTVLTTPEQVKKFLVTAYSSADYSRLLEYSSDNVVDNNATYIDKDDDNKTIRFNLSSYGREDDEMFAWKQVVSSSSTDTPYAIWANTYSAIASANHALVSIAEIREKGGLSSEQLTSLKASEAEALLIRAYHHFILVNIFSKVYRNDDLSKQDLGIPYVKIPESTVYVNYDRGTVTSVYENIQEDLEAALKILEKQDIVAAADTRKYHFNKTSANAFAARFYLYKRDYEKVVEHANYVLGTNPAALTMVWSDFEGVLTNDGIANVWGSTESPSNLFLLPTYSLMAYHIGMSAFRYACNHDAAKATFTGFVIGCGKSPHPFFTAGGLYSSGGQQYGVWSAKIAPLFEYTDKVSGVGYPHMVRREFRIEDVLLMRAEAYIYLNRISDAFQDLKTWNLSLQNLPETVKAGARFTEITESDVVGTYSKDNSIYVNALNTEKISPDFVISSEQLPYVRCLLHFRRLETMLEGFRWFDIKRYGIEIEHVMRNDAERKDVVDKLTWDDSRRAIQLPAEVIAAGMKGN